MKKVLLVSAFALFLSGIASAAPCNLQRCKSTITGDSGHTSKTCDAPGGVDGCACTTASTGCTNVVIGTIPGGYHLLGYLDGTSGICAGNGAGCILKDNKLINPESGEVVEESADQQLVYNELSRTFEPAMGERADTYFGYVDGSIRSPNNGRVTSAHARLDACLHYVDVDAITGADNSEKWTNCYGSQGCGTTIKNEYCNATTTNNGTSMAAGVCKDRCDCVFGFGTCESL
jgi:hypothetical protein